MSCEYPTRAGNSLGADVLASSSPYCRAHRSHSLTLACDIGSSLSAAAALLTWTRKSCSRSLWYLDEAPSSVRWSGGEASPCSERMQRKSEPKSRTSKSCVESFMCENSSSSKDAISAAAPFHVARTVAGVTRRSPSLRARRASMKKKPATCAKKPWCSSTNDCRAGVWRSLWSCRRRCSSKCAQNQSPLPRARKTPAQRKTGVRSSRASGSASSPTSPPTSRAPTARSPGGMSAASASASQCASRACLCAAANPRASSPISFAFALASTSQSPKERIVCRSM
mmetsp:Transcript_14487/g.47599  ORF Transcript_14487/g.47599 Transcript_14487/m.47599 type:complete len:283 (+) Transcript_14487:362-1210(+)